MTAATTRLAIEENARIETWFGVGGRADRLARASSAEAVAEAVALDPNLCVLGDGANLLVKDEGVGVLVLTLEGPALVGWRMDPQTGVCYVGAGALLPRLVTESVRQGLGGLEGLGGVPATVGGALVMNAGGAFGEIGQVVTRVHAMDRQGRQRTLERDEIPFGYRQSGLEGLILLGAELALEPGDPAALRARLKETMAYKKRSQPLKADSAGCCFKNPTLGEDLEGIGPAGARVSAGLLIDRAGCKGERVGGAEVSRHHANFIETAAGARADDVVALMELVEGRVLDRFGVSLEREVVVWGRS